MKLRILVVMALAAAGLAAVSSSASATAPTSYQLPVTYRDFLYSGTTVPGPGHPDFQNENFGLQTGLVNPLLGADHKPVWQSNQQSLSGAVNFCWWYHDTGCNGVASQNPYEHSVTGAAPDITLNETETNVYQTTNTAYYPIDGLGWNSDAIGSPQTDADCSLGGAHNFAFTQEIHTYFVYHASTSPTLAITTSHDTWVFINDHLAIDLGGVHAAATGSVTLNPATAATLGLTDGSVVPLDLFTAQRHTCGSVFNLTTSGLALGRAPQVAVSGVADGSRYPIGAVPTATCSVTSDIDGSPTVAPVLSTPSNGDGTGQQSATCTYTDTAGQTGTASVTYTIEPSAVQTITFTSTPPAHVVTGTPYTVTATGGWSGNPVVFITDPTSAGCEIASDGTVTFYEAGLCKIDAGQAAGGGFHAAKTVQQKIRIYLINQVVTITSTPPAHALVATPYTLTATGGESGNPVGFSVAPTSVAVCSVSSDGTVTFAAAGRCNLIATQAGNAVYARGIARQLVVVYHT